AFVILPRLTMPNEMLRIGVLFVLVNVTSAFLFLAVEHPANQLIRWHADQFMMKLKTAKAPEMQVKTSPRNRLVLIGVSLSILLTWYGLHFWLRPASGSNGQPKQEPAPGRLPSVVSVNPTSGSGTNQTFSIAISSPKSATDVGIFLIINSGLSGAGGCQIVFNRSMNLLWVVADNGSTWGSPATVGAGSTLSNSQCGLSPDESSLSQAGDVLTLNLKLSFKPTFSGLKNIYVMAADQRGQGNGWREIGAWTVANGSSLAPSSPTDSAR